jgi:hypothetical protein
MSRVLSRTSGLTPSVLAGSSTGGKLMMGCTVLSLFVWVVFGHSISSFGLLRVVSITLTAISSRTERRVVFARARGSARCSGKLPSLHLSDFSHDTGLDRSNSEVMDKKTMLRL